MLRRPAGHAAVVMDKVHRCEITLADGRCIYGEGDTYAEAEESAICEAEIAMCFEWPVLDHEPIP